MIFLKTDMDEYKLDRAVGIIGTGFCAACMCGGAIAIFCDNTFLIGLAALIGVVIGCLFQANKEK